MKKIFTTSALIIAGMGVFAQSDIYTPATIPGGATTGSYNAVISFTVPTTADIQTSTLGIPNIPGVPIPATVNATITKTILTVAGLPAGVNGVFDHTNGSYNSTESGTLTLTGMPTASGAFNVQITSVTEGSFSVAGQNLSFPGTVPIVGTAIPPAPNVFDKSYPMNVSGSASIQDLSKSDFSVVQNMPNPFSGVTTIAFNTPAPANVGVKVFDMLGKEVSTQNINTKAGVNEVEFDGSNLKEGIYFYSVTNGSKTFTQKMQVRK